MDRSKLKYRQSVVALILDSKGNILLVQKKNYDNNQWDIPGGGIEKKENCETALKRELNEELGTINFKIINKSKIIDQFEWPDDVIANQLKSKGVTFRGQQRHQYLLMFIGDKKQIMFPADELKAIKWVSIDKLDKHLIFPGQYVKIKSLLSEFGFD